MVIIFTGDETGIILFTRGIVGYDYKASLCSETGDPNVRNRLRIRRLTSTD